MQQKQRHLSTGKYYDQDVKWLLAAYGASHAALWLSFFILLCTPHWKMALVIMAARSAACWLLWAVTAAKTGEKKLFLFPVFDIAWMAYNFAFFPYIAWKNKKNWK